MEIDIFNDSVARADAIAKSGQRRIPVVLFGGEVVVGFDPAKLRSLSLRHTAEAGAGA